MPTTDSNLTGTFIANTYQKLLQADTNYGSVGTTATFSISNAVTTSKHTLLNGLGETVPGLAIDTTGNGNGGLMFKDTNSDPGGLWSIQTYETSNNEGGLNFWRPNAGGNPNDNNAKLFLKNTGTVWIGYQNSGAPIIPVDVSGHSLYVKDGVKSGIYSGWADFPNSGEQSNFYSLTNKVLQLGNNNEIFTSGISEFSSNTFFDNQLSNYCDDVSISNQFFLPQSTSDCKIIWSRIGQVVFCSFIITNTTYLGESGNVQRAIIPVPVNTLSGYNNRGNGGFDSFGFGSGAAYVSPDNGGGRNSNYNGNDNSLEGVEVKMGGAFGGNQKSYFTVSVNYEGSSGDINSWRGSFAYLV
jgi:hypothetical protein